jgi:hypothetical protein
MMTERSFCVGRCCERKIEFTVMDGYDEIVNVPDQFFHSSRNMIACIIRYTDYFPVTFGRLLDTRP